MYTMQEAFEKVSRHLFAQGRQSKKTDSYWGSMCAYRGDNGMSCAIGVLIPDSKYLPEMDAFSGDTDVCSLMKRFNPQYLEGLNIYFLLDLQFVHDGDDNWGSSGVMRISLAIVGEKYDLDTSFLGALSFERVISPEDHCC